MLWNDTKRLWGTFVGRKINPLDMKGEGLHWELHCIQPLGELSHRSFEYSESLNLVSFKGFICTDTGASWRLEESLQLESQQSVDVWGTIDVLLVQLTHSEDWKKESDS